MQLLPMCPILMWTCEFPMVRREPVVTFSEAGNLISKDVFSTPVCRYSFLVGQNERSHTAQQQLLPILVDDKHDPSLDQLENAFNIETVTKEFFAATKACFYSLKKRWMGLLPKMRTFKQSSPKKDWKPPRSC